MEQQHRVCLVLSKDLCSKYPFIGDQFRQLVFKLSYLLENLDLFIEKSNDLFLFNQIRYGHLQSP